MSGSISRHNRTERGATVAEAAIVGPLFFLLLFAVIEFGLLFRTSLTTNHTATDAARAGASAEIPGFADWEILKVVKRDTVALDTGSLQRIVVFRGDRSRGFDSTVPDACLTGTTGVSGVCNVYFPADLALTRDQYASPSYVRDNDWPGNTRDDNRFGSNDPSSRDYYGTDFIGVHVRSRHQSVTGFFGTSRTLSSTTVMAIEPKRNEEVAS